MTRPRALFQWEHIAEDEYLGERRRIARAIDELPAVTTAGPSDDAIAIIGKVGEPWDEMTTDSGGGSWISDSTSSTSATAPGRSSSCRPLALASSSMLRVESSPHEVGSPFIQRG